MAADTYYPLGSRAIARGSDGTDVRWMALRLGYESSVPGVFDYNLENRVKAYQQSKGLVPDGRVGPQTWGALFAQFPGPWAEGFVPRPGSTPTQPGISNALAGGVRTSFEWLAPASLSIGSLAGWTAAQNRLTAAAATAGFEVQYASYETRLGLQSIYSLVYRGLSPVGMTSADAINNRLTSLAEQAGFSIIHNAVTTRTGQIVAGGNPNGQPSASPLLFVALAVGLVLVAREFMD